MDKKSGYLIKNVGLLTISNFSSKILVFLLVPLYTSVLTTAEYGTYDLMISIVTLLYPILTLNITDAVMRFLMDRDYNKNEVASIGIKIVLTSIGIFTVLLVLFSLFLKLLNRSELFTYLPYLEFYYIFYVFNQYFIQLAKGLEKVRDMSIAGVLSTLIMLIANILFLLIFRLGLSGFFMANILCQAIQGIYLAVRVRVWSYLKWDTNNSIRKDMLVYCVPLIVTALAWVINHTLDKFVVAIICGVAANGILSVAYKIPQIINTLQVIFIQAWQISAIKEFGENDTPYFYGKTFQVINLFMTLMCSFLILLSKPLATILYANDFYLAWKYVPFLMIANVLNSASGFLGPILSAQKKSKEMATSAIYGTITNGVLNILLVYFIGIQGATIATMISSFVIYLVRKKVVKQDIHIDNYSFILIGWTLLVVQAVVEIYTLYWWLELGIILLLMIINKRYVNELFFIVKKVTKR